MSGMKFESLAVGDRIATVDKGVITTAHIMRWSAAVENWHRIHYDQAFATGHDKLPNVLINGSWKQHVLVQLVKDGLGPAGWLWKLKFRYRRMDVAGDALRADDAGEPGGDLLARGKGRRRHGRLVGPRGPFRPRPACRGCLGGARGAAHGPSRGRVRGDGTQHRRSVRRLGRG
jgi:hypothetical protein